jgi:hypothetical protein
MYSVNGIALDNPSLQWKLRSPTKPLSEYSRPRPSVRLPGADGVVAGLPGNYDPVTLPFVVETPRANLEALMALFAGEGTVRLTDAPTREVAFETLTMSPVGYGDADALVDVTFMLRFPKVWWRGLTATTTTAQTIGSASVDVVNLFPGMSAPIQDAIVRVKGGLGLNMIVQDDGGSFFLHKAALGTAEWLRFESATGRAFITTSDVWIGGTEVGADIDYGGPRGVFEITPTWTSTPATRSGKLRVLTGSRSGTPSIQVRGKVAHLV